MSQFDVFSANVLPFKTVKDLEKALRQVEDDRNRLVIGFQQKVSGTPPVHFEEYEWDDPSVINVINLPTSELIVEEVPRDAQESVEGARERFREFIAPRLKDAELIEKAALFINGRHTEVVLLRPISTAAVTAPSSPVDLSWDTKPARKAWSADLIAAVTAHQAELAKANADAFLNGYSTLSPQLQVKFWAELIIAMAKFESAWKPDTKFFEPPPLRQFSVGLLQLSYEDQPIYRFAPPVVEAAKSLEDPLVNLRCGMKVFAKLVAQDKMVVSGDGNHRGAARYWSVLRAGSKHHLADIKALTKKHVGL
jgi:hypothetical protein